MEEQRIEVYGRTYEMEIFYKLKANDLITALEKLTLEVQEKQASHNLFPGVDIYGIYVGYDCKMWILDNYTDGTMDILKCSTVVSRRRNEKLVEGIYFESIELNREVKHAVMGKNTEYIKKIKELVAKMEKEEQQEREERTRRKNEWSCTKVYTKAQVRGILTVDAEYKSANGEIVRMVTRYTDEGEIFFPKRFEKDTDNIMSKEMWTEAEKRVNDWLLEFEVEYE